MKYDLKVTHNGIIKKLTIEPSRYHDKKVYQVTTDIDNLVLYHEDNEWRQDDGHHLSPEWINKVGKAINAIEEMVNLPTF